jgi:hypothetical protein
MAPSHSPSHLTVKKKFLLANKHITKSVFVTLHTRHLYRPLMARSPARLNSTLSVRIEELNAQISTLHVENLRLRTSEISLSTQLKKEKERSQRILTDAESAVRFHRLYSSLTKFPTFYALPQFRSHSIIGCPFSNVATLSP